MKRKSDYTPAQWADLYPNQRYAIERADADRGQGRDLAQVRAADGRGVIFVDLATGKQVDNPVRPRF